MGKNVSLPTDAQAVEIQIATGTSHGPSLQGPSLQGPSAAFKQDHHGSRGRQPHPLENKGTFDRAGSGNRVPLQLETDCGHVQP